MTSLDGYIETNDKDISWHVWGKDMEQYMNDFFESVDTILLGRKAFEIMEDYWPSEKAKTEDPIIAGRMNDTQKIVFSKTRHSSDWENTIFVNDIEMVTNLKQKPGKNIVLFGGAELANTLMQKGLLDEYYLIVNPVALGMGNPLFKEHKSLKLLDSKTMESGNVILHYTNP